MRARELVLLLGLDDWVSLDWVHNGVRQEFPDVPVAAVQQRTLDLVRALVDEGLCEIGDLGSDGREFTAWDVPLEEAIARIRSVYVDRFDDDNTWPWYAWLNLTAKGDRVAEDVDRAQRQP